MMREFYRSLGRTGVKVSPICLGCMSFGNPIKWRDWVLDEASSLPIIQQALAAGINFFDTADMYSVGESEVILGSVLRKLNVKRESVVIATKVFFPLDPADPNSGGLSRKHIMDAIDGSLSRLQMSYVDLYQIHRFDEATPIEETMRALHDCVVAGKVRYVGASSMHAWQFQQMNHVAEKNGWTKFISMQNYYNLLYREEEREMIPYCENQGIAVLPWSPLARGMLARPRDTTTTTRAKSDPFIRVLYKAEQGDFELIDRVEQLAKKRKVPMAQIALAFLLHQPFVTSPIVGITKLSQLEDAIAAVTISLSEEELQFLTDKYLPHPVQGIYMSNPSPKKKKTPSKL